jgi:hypothetical protein
VPYTEQNVLYINRVPGLAIGSVVSIYLNNVLAGTTTILDTTGLYVYELSLDEGVLEVKSIFADSTEATQTFFCVNLYGLINATAEIWSAQRQANLLLLTNQYLTPQTTGIFRGQVGQDAMSANYGSIIDFPQPFDWSFEQYALTMGGDLETGRPGVYGAKTKGSSTGAVKDMVLAVTGYTMTDQDFRGLQGVGWQLGRAHVNDLTVLANYNPTAPLLMPFPVMVTITGYTAGADNFTWQMGITGATGATGGTGRITTAGNIELVHNYGVFLQFDTVAGHCIGDSWQATILPSRAAGPTSFTPRPPYKYRYSGNPLLPVLDTDPLNVNGPHYFLQHNQPSVLPNLAPVATLKSGVQQAYTLLLNIVHDGFFVDSETVIRNLTGQEDSVNYNWLNPWGTSPTFVTPDLHWRQETTTITGTLDHTLVAAHIPLMGSELITINGVFLYPSQYIYASPTVVELDPSLVLTTGDIVQFNYREAGNAQGSYEETVGATPAFPYVITLPAAPAPLSYGMSVYANGLVLSADKYLIVGNQITIPAQFEQDDKLCVRFYVSGLNSFAEVDHIGPQQDYVFPFLVNANSVLVRVNGALVKAGNTTLVDPVTVRLSAPVYNYLQADDEVSIIADVGVPAGYSVRIVQGTTVYTQGVDFKIDYTYGTIIWLLGHSAPARGTSYQVSYIYFPKQILTKLLNLVKPSTIKLIPQFRTTNGLVFNPYQWGGVDNPTGHVILPE